VTSSSEAVGIGFRPPRYLGHGDVVRCEIGGIGVLENRITDRGR
jgi:2-keto-4-pentenoate hydratase/2-oxohepta-3-ene-1,7-dioic acid hydratase in catechol pathway